ncbi:MAG: hypothetical protein Q9160_005355 [Pyrenula sp. 1 TL-2023]
MHRESSRNRMSELIRIFIDGFHRANIFDSVKVGSARGVEDGTTSRSPFFHLTPIKRSQEPASSLTFTPRLPGIYFHILFCSHNMPSSCREIRDALATCLQSSDCIMIDRHSPVECLTPPLLETLPTQCQQLSRGLGQCKRGMVDMRKRFRGNAPIATSRELEGGGAGAGGMLYGGTGVGSGEGAGNKKGEEMPEDKTRGL